jgi:hypothetical protein
MKVKINTIPSNINAEDTIVGSVYCTSAGADPLLRIDECAIHDEASDTKIAFLRLCRADVSTVLYPPSQKMIHIGEPTITID